MPALEIVGPKILKAVYTPRQPWVHKGYTGQLLVVGGSETLTGSPVFNSLAAYRAGCDMVYIAAPERAANVAAHFSPNLMTIPLEGNALARVHVPFILKQAERASALVIGSGLGREPETFSAVQELVRRIDKPFVLDADGLRALAGFRRRILRGKKAVLTPHATEFYELTGVKVSENERERAEAARALARDLRCTVLLKGHVDAVSDGTHTALNKSGTPLMTKGGCGDTLAGICGAYLARGVEPYAAAKAAAFVNGKAGELAGKEFGEGMLATDLIERIPQAIKR